jgi:PAS domain S-box-containing protein
MIVALDRQRAPSSGRRGAAGRNHMAKYTVQPTGRESPFGDDEIIVSKTDLKGRLTYANDVFLRVSRYSAKQILGQPHSIIRHPDMPRCVFKLLWDTLEAKGELFAYVLNMASNGDHYWVFAHVTPSFDAAGTVVGYHSNRRKPEPGQIDKIAPLYRSLLEAERGAADRKQGMHLSHDQLFAMLKTQGVAYDEFVFAV